MKPAPPILASPSQPETSRWRHRHHRVDLPPPRPSARSSAIPAVLGCAGVLAHTMLPSKAKLPRWCDATGGMVAGLLREPGPSSTSLCRTPGREANIANCHRRRGGPARPAPPARLAACPRTLSSVPPHGPGGSPPHRRGRDRPVRGARRRGHERAHRNGVAVPLGPNFLMCE